MKIRLLFVPVLLALVSSLAACGGSSQSVPANAVAMVNGTPVTIAQFNQLFEQAKAQAKAQNQPVPTPGSQQWTTARNTTVAQLVELVELQQQMKKEGVTVTQADVNKYIANLVKTSYGGSEQKFLAAAKSAGFSLEAVKQRVYINLLGTRLHDKVTKSATVTPQEEKQYYDQNRAQYMTQAKLNIAASKKLANTIEQKLRNGASFAALAKQYSQDPGSASQGGKFTATQGKEVPAYDKAAFSLKTGELSGLIDATSPTNGGFGYFIMKPLGPAKTTGNPPQTTRSMEHILVAIKSKPVQQPFSQVKDTIRQTLLSQKQQTLWTDWLTNLQNEYKGKVSYQSGYTPPPTTAVATTG